MTPSSEASPNTTTGARAPGYSAIRVAAEWASAARDQDLRFGFDPAGNATQGEGGVPMYTPSYATRPRLTSLTLAYEGVLPVTLDGESASAAFWSESAVEKFMLPYCASLFGVRAGDFLTRLCRAWYRFPDTVEVCALVYTLGPQAREGVLLPEDAVQLLCVPTDEAPAIRTPLLLSLREFEYRFGSVDPLVARQVPPSFAGAEPPDPEASWRLAAAVDSVVARDAAEFLSGYRDRWVWFTAADQRLVSVPRALDDTGGEPENTVFWGAMPSARPRPSPRVTARVTDADGQTVDVGISPGEAGGRVLHPDSVFWTDHAVEALLLPYYASVKGWTAPYWNVCLMGQWDGLDDPEAAFASLAARVAAAGGPSRASADSGDSSVFAVTHLPRSEYVSDGSGALEARTLLLTLENGTSDARAVAG